MDQCILSANESVNSEQRVQLLKPLYKVLHSETPYQLLHGK